ncbi:MAG: hypothetical protein Kapaf2KO_23780 [Candidatus Kapaibacteriales bacterium]
MINTKNSLPNSKEWKDLLEDVEILNMSSEIIGDMLTAYGHNKMAEDIQTFLKQKAITFSSAEAKKLMINEDLRKQGKDPELHPDRNEELLSHPTYNFN